MKKLKYQNLNRGFYLLPNFFTTAGLFAGFYSVVAALKGLYSVAAMVIFIGMIFDGFDGRIARLTNTESAFGAEYDSLADMVTFGVAPALVVYSWALNSLHKPGWVAAFIFAAGGALRLARFNTQVGIADKRFFQGLPIPMAAALIAAMVWTCEEYGIHGSFIPVTAAIVTVIAGLLMVSNVRYYSFKDLDFKNNVPFVVIIASVLLIACILLDPPPVLLTLISLYIVSGLVISAWHKWLKFRHRPVR